MPNQYTSTQVFSTAVLLSDFTDVKLCQIIMLNYSYWQSIKNFAHSSFQYALQMEYPLYMR